MATPSGAISFEDIRTEFGQPSANNSLNNYYSGGPALGAPLANVPASGAISMSELRIIEKTGGSGDRVNVGSGVPNGTHIIFTTTGDCYSNTTGTAALLVPSGRTGATTLVVASGHNISGKSGNGGNGQAVTYSDITANAAGTGTAGNGTAGGPAIQLASTTHLDNNGALFGGCGGGGGGSAFGMPQTGFIDNGITCTTTNLKGIVTNTNGSTRFTIGTAGGGGGGGNNPASQSDGSGGSAGGGGHTTNFANGNQVTVTSGTQCTANTSYFSQRTVRLVANSNAGGVPGGGGSGFAGAGGGDGGGNGNAGNSTTALNGTHNFPTVSANGNSVSSGTGSNADGASGGAVGNAITGWNSYSVTVHGIVSTQGSFNGGIS